MNSESRQSHKTDNFLISNGVSDDIQLLKNLGFSLANDELIFWQQGSSDLHVSPTNGLLDVITLETVRTLITLHYVI